MARTKLQQTATFEHRKKTFLGKDDKSSAGGIDVHCREICDAVNDRDDMFTTSSCSGRAFLWRGEGVKSTGRFSRYRVTHEVIPEGGPYFDLPSLSGEVVDGAWEELQRTREKAPQQLSRRRGFLTSAADALCRVLPCGAAPRVQADSGDHVVWLRFEPFILHVCCRDFPAAAELIAACRQVFKNVGVQGWSDNKVMVAIWGDEGVEMALTDPAGRVLFDGQVAWLQEQVNSRHQRNWAKIDRFTAAVRAMPAARSDTGMLSLAAAAGLCGLGADSGDEEVAATAVGLVGTAARRGPRHFDVIGDVALLSSLAEDADKAAVGADILKENGKIRIVALRCGALQGDLKTQQLEVIAGPDRRPLITTHTEFGVRYMVNLEAAFFNPRMGPERQRLCGLVRPQEEVCVLFAGCCPEALQIAAKTEAQRVVAVELNAEAVQCARRSLQLLAKHSPSRAACVSVLQGDVHEVVRDLPRGGFDRVLAPRPKGTTEAEDDEMVDAFLDCLIPLLRSEGVCHWYDFVADWEFPACERSVSRISRAVTRHGRSCTVLRSAAANNKPVAERQYRTVIDFSVS